MRWDLTEAHALVVRFAEDRDWAQFHNPKNLSMALAAEAGELLDVFQWLSPEASEPSELSDVNNAGEELADVVIYALLLAERLGLDLSRIVVEKMAANAARYPVEAARGNANKAPSERTRT